MTQLKVHHLMNTGHSPLPMILKQRLEKRKRSTSLTCLGSSKTNCSAMNFDPNSNSHLIFSKHGQLTWNKSKWASLTLPDASLSLTWNGLILSKANQLISTMFSQASTQCIDSIKHLNNLHDHLVLWALHLATLLWLMAILMLCLSHWLRTVNISVGRRW
jgi:hypothetical protein